ncbi:MAG: beta-lactamase family protein [Clostridia bacterium]|nr:beta-lactamase family protein [Clostridia bacterium]
MSVSWSSGISTAALRRFVSQLRKRGCSPRAFHIYKNGETASAVFPPYRADEGMHLYSLSKSFTSVCVGIAEDMGLLSTEERMADIFPDKLPEQVSDHLAEMRLGDVLSMQSGHEVCHLNAMRFSEDAVRTFLAMPVVYKPGTTFVYSTGGTSVCGAAVARRAGMPLRDFMNEHLFRPLGIENRKPVCCADGTHCGGTGIFISPEELFRFGMMLLRKGTYEGKRIVSESYLDRATSPIADNSGNGTPDWVVGYGYQFWRNARGGFRGDGAYGQYCIVVPEEDAVFTLEETSPDLQGVVDDVFELFSTVCGRDMSEAEELEEDVRSFYALPACPVPERGSMTFEDNPAGIRGAEWIPEEGGLRVTFDTDYGKQSILAGSGRWLDSHPMLRFCKPGLIDLDPHFGWIENFHLRSALRRDEDGFTVVARHTDVPHTQTFRFAPDGLHISADGNLAEGVRFLRAR